MIGISYMTKSYSKSFHQKIQSNAALAMTGAIPSTSSKKLYQEVG